MRKSHRKSRNGCLQCKQRHVKCNEVLPRCGNCQRLNIPCSFTSVPSVSPTPGSLVESPSVAVVPTSSHTHPLSVLDLELYHHLVYDSSAFLIIRKHVRDHLVEKILQLALTKDYLLHNLLAFSALHLYHKDRSRIDFFERACYLQGMAIQQVQPVIANLTQDHAIPALIFSGNTAAFGLAEHLLNPHHCTDPTDPIDKILDCVQLSRGVKLVVSPYWDYLKSSWLSPLLGLDTTVDEDKTTLESDFPTYKLIRSLAFGQEDPERRQVCLLLIDQVFTFMRMIITHREKYPTPTYFVNAWAVQSDTIFRDMITERKPVALVVLAHYTVLMNLESRAWHIRGWPQLLLNRIDSVLDPEWSDFLRRPKEMILGDGPYLRESS